jgi:hypothetical protein
MSHSTNIQLVQAYFDALAKGELEKLGQLFAADVIWHQPGNSHLSGRYTGQEQLFAFFGKLMELSEGSFRIDEVRAIMENGDLVAAMLHFRARRAGREMAMAGVDLMRIENGKIKEVWLFSGDQEAEDHFWAMP